MKIIQDIHIPDSIARWIEQHDGVNLSININSASSDYGYAHMVYHTVSISILTRTCNRCGYDPLWNPDDTDSKCIRHTYNSPRYDKVFCWNAFRNPNTLEEAFNHWLELNKERENDWRKAIVIHVSG